jgi:hypothetical protein
MNKQLKMKIISRYGTQADFALAVGDDEALVSRVVRERKILRPEKEEKWANLLGCKLIDIFPKGGCE